ncbi:sensor histidine kinase [Thalassotalea profundi]|nr:ATP-binding protein [Thalassotalea profundi]
MRSPKYYNDTCTLQRESYHGELALLRQQSEQLAQVINVMPSGMVLLDGDGIVIKINKIASQLLDEPILGQPWFDVIRRSFKPRADDWHEVSLKDGRRVKLEITPLVDQPGQLILITDLTETRLLQDKLGQLQRLSSLGQMVSKLAHQIRTPLSAAMLYGANLKNKTLKTEDREAFQHKLMSRLEDLEQQVNDMLLFAKSGKQQVVEPISINQLVLESSNSVEALIKKANAKLIIKPCPDDCQILGNKRALSGAIVNLIHNALQVIPDQAEIRIESRCHNEHAFISVIDNGKGIESALANKIFEPFYTSRVNGTGLGLAVVKSVVNAHQGDVQLLSDAGEGAHFCMKLPLLTEKVKQEEQQHSHEFINKNMFKSAS